MLRVSLEEAKPRLLDLINAVLKGETVFIIKDFQETVQLVPAVPLPRRQFGSAKGLIVMAENFDAPLPDFSEYMP
jgi:antitoxin (DNA-binding transcriptional repressor) of toxin-antitoxin stability system